jgi:alkanesulfonate monooxygenase
LVGTADQVAEALLEYYKLGATTLLVRGFDPINDAEYWGRELIPLLREKVHNYLKNKVNFYVRS